MTTLEGTGRREWSTYDLVSLNYRQLQAKAKEMELPGNLKHDVLIEVIKARYAGNEELVKQILATEKYTRAKKKAAKKLQSSFHSLNNQKVSPQVKRVGRPRKKSLDNSFKTYHNPSKSPEFSNGDKRNASLPLPVRSNNMPIAHSIQQLLMDRRVPNASTKKQQPYNMAMSTPAHERYTFKSVHRMKDPAASHLIYEDNFNCWQIRKSLENGNPQSNSNNTVNVIPTNLDYSCAVNPQFSWGTANLPILGTINNSQPTDNGDLNGSNEYLPDLEGLLTSNGPTLPLNIVDSSAPPSSSSSVPQFPPIFLRQDLWPYPDNSTGQGFQPVVPFPSQTCSDYGNWSTWNTSQISPYLNNPTLGYSEEVIISETQNSDTLSAPENPDNLPPPSYYSGSSVLPENDNQVYWPRAEPVPTNFVDAYPFNSCQANELNNNNNDFEKGGLPQMKVSVVDTHEWTYEFSSSSGLFTQQFI